MLRSRSTLDRSMLSLPCRKQNNSDRGVFPVGNRKREDMGMCEHCNDNNDVFLSERTLSKNSEALTGIGCYICSENKTLSIEACIDNTYVKPLYIEKDIKINYCPMCGRKLD